MRYLLLILLLSLAFMTSCSDGPFEVDEDQIQSMVAHGELNILNKSDQTIYYFVVDSEVLPVIFWAPKSSDENRLRGFTSKSFPLNEILSGDKESGTVVFFYWQKEEDISTEDIKSIGINID